MCMFPDDDQAAEKGSFVLVGLYFPAGSFEQLKATTPGPLGRSFLVPRLLLPCVTPVLALDFISCRGVCGQLSRIV